MHPEKKNTGSNVFVIEYPNGLIPCRTKNLTTETLRKPPAQAAGQGGKLTILVCNENTVYVFLDTTSQRTFVLQTKWTSIVIQELQNLP